MRANDTAAGQLRSIVERIVRLEEEKAEIADLIKAVYAEAKGTGFDAKALRRIVKEARETASDREARHEAEALLEVYRAALGMLDGTPLGDAARKRLLPDEPEPDRDEREGDGGGAVAASTPPPSGAMSEGEVAAAREAGERAAGEGERIIDNPFVAGDPRRAAWDEGYCACAGSDGMDIPKAFRRAEKPRKGKADGEGAGAGGEA